MDNQNQDVVISVRNLKKRFGDLGAVNDISFDIPKGEIFGFLGPNGAGKTTAINMICGLSPPTEGEVLINWKKTKNQSGIKSIIGICPQENIHWQKLTCKEQLNFMGRMYGLNGSKVNNRASELLELLGLTEKSEVFASKLSGGMKRRLNICLALIHDPEILVLDEPEAGLDPQSRLLVRDFIKSLAKEKTVILTTHNMDEADRLSDRVGIIDHGKLLLLDSPEKLKKSIGEGDILEINLEINKSKSPEELKSELRNNFEKVALSNSILTIKSKNLIASISNITKMIEQHGYKVKAMTMRENTLEDVFIHLTGRKLRQ